VTAAAYIAISILALALLARPLCWLMDRAVLWAVETAQPEPRPRTHRSREREEHHRAALARGEACRWCEEDPPR